MKLYAFQPTLGSFGPYSFFVMAKDEESALKAVKQKINENGYHQSYLPDFCGGREEYNLTILEENEVIENENG